MYSNELVSGIHFKPFPETKRRKTKRRVWTDKTNVRKCSYALNLSNGYMGILILVSVLLKMFEHFYLKIWRVSVSATTYEQLRNCHSHAHKKKVKRTKNQQLFLDPSENWGVRANLHDENWREVNRDLQSQDQLSGAEVARAINW